ncbi:MAG: metallophosphoesterase [Sedimentisphaerales bacterium]|nr:metallophosphoesterase [Sedimentisphaerales bacterium]
MAKKESKPKRKAKGPPKANHAGNVILHISDLHFGKPISDSELRDKKIVFDQFNKTLSNLSKDWWPTCLCITGDISHKNETAGYIEGAKWLVDLMDLLSIDKNNLFICPGNHDLDRDCAATIQQPKTEAEIDHLITIKRQVEFEKPFQKYIEFLENIGVSKYHYTENNLQTSFLFGMRLTSGLMRFVCYSPYFHDWDDKSKQVVIIGNKPLDWMEGERLISRRPNYEEVCVVLMHCPRERMADTERHSYNSLQPATWHRIATMSHLILTGHDHQKPEPFDSTGWWAYTSGIGTIFNGIKYGNSFQLIKINRMEQCFEQKPFYWSEGSLSWIESEGFQKKWPFKREKEESEFINTSAQDESSGERAKNLADHLWECIRKRDYNGAEILWNKDKNWYLATKDKIHHRWSKQIDQCVLEINLMRDNP